MIDNKFFGEYFKCLRKSKSLTYESALENMGLPAEDIWVTRLRYAEENGFMKNRFFKRLKAFYDVTDETLNSITEAAKEHRKRNTDNGRFFSFMKQIIKHRDLILATPKYSNITIDGVWLQSPYFGGGLLYLGALLNLWSDEELVSKCDECGGNVYMTEGLLILSSWRHSGLCIECGHFHCYWSDHPQFKRNFKNAWDVLSKFRKEKTSDEPATVKEMLRDILKDEEHYEDIVKEYHLDENDSEPVEIEFEPGYLCFKEHKFTL